MPELTLFSICCTPGCVRTDIVAHGLCQKDYQRDYQRHPARRAAKAAWKARRDARVRAALGLHQWPCKQCGSLIDYEPRGGNRMRVCKTCAPDSRFRSMVRRYGVDKQMFDAMYFDQDGRCAIATCSREAKAVDHDHVTGAVRGLLCKGCNVAVGFIETNGWLPAALNYIAA